MELDWEKFAVSLELPNTGTTEEVDTKDDLVVEVVKDMYLEINLNDSAVPARHEKVCRREHLRD